MPDAKDFAMHDPVEFPFSGGLVRGHIARKNRSRGVIVDAEGRAYDVPWRLLQRHAAGVAKRVSLPGEAALVDFLPGDQVAFSMRSQRLQGVVIGNGPKRARVSCDGQTYTVPYPLLRAVDSRERDSNRKRLADCVVTAEALIQQHGLVGWSFQFDSTQRRAGVCAYNTKVIGLSRLYCLKASAEQVRDTILHEIAHALAGPRHNHDAVWTQIARSIGCTAERCHNVDFAPAKYISSCPRCGWQQQKHRRLRGAVCRTCKRPVTYTPFTRQAWEACAQGDSSQAIRSTDSGGRG